MNEKISCPACGAPVTAPADAQTVQCEFCDTTVKVPEAARKQGVQVSISLGGLLGGDALNDLMNISLGGDSKKVLVSTSVGGDALNELMNISFGDDGKKVLMNTSLGGDAQNDLTRGEQCLTVKDWQGAYRAFAAALMKDADSYEGWKGLLGALTANFSRPTQAMGWTNLDGRYGLSSAVKNAYQYAPDDGERGRLSMHLRMAADNGSKEMGGAASQEEEEYLNYQQKAKSWGWIAISALVLFMLVVDPIAKYAVEAHSPGTMLLLAIFCIPMFIWGANASKRNARKPAYQKSRENMGQIDQFRTIISPYSGSSGPSRSIPDDSEDTFAGRD